MSINTEVRGREAAASSHMSAHARPTREAPNPRLAQTSGTARPANSGRPVVATLPAIFAAPPGVLMNAFLRNPWTFIRYMQDEMDRDFPTAGTTDSPSGQPGELGARGTPDGKATWAPAMEVFRRDGNLVVHAELPGLRTDDIDLSIQDEQLVISGERKQQEEIAKEGIYRSERRYGFFQRAVPLPDGVKEEQVSASFSDGVLEVRVPLPEPPAKSARKIKIS